MSNDLRSRIETSIKNTQNLYLSDDLPWVIGYSGGKDSTATLQLVWIAISQLPEAKRGKPIHVISTDTLVENPVVALWVKNSLDAMRVAASRAKVGIEPHRLTPALADRFWVNLIGRGYPAPRPKFRWCTSRLKISASSRFITEVADKHGEAILVLGSRKAESAARAKVLDHYEHSTRELLSRNGDASLDRVWIYTPISSWSNDEVWEYLITCDNPWGYDNNELFHMYRGATPDAECPLVVDKSTPSCGDSRFGCFVCTLVSEDKSMQAMIQNDKEKHWMAPLLEFRNEFLKTEGDRVFREFTRMTGQLTLHYLDINNTRETPVPYREVDTENGRKNAVLVHGPYTQKRREEILTALLKAQLKVANKAPESVGKFELISLEELEEIRRIWVNEKHEFEDRVPQIYESVMGCPYPRPELDEATPFRAEDVRLLREVCDEMQIKGAQDDCTNPEFLHFRLLRELLHTQHGYRSSIRRVGLTAALEKALESASYDNEEQALEFALMGRRIVKDSATIHEDPYIRPTEPRNVSAEEEIEL